MKFSMAVTLEALGTIRMAPHDVWGLWQGNSFVNNEHNHPINISDWPIEATNDALLSSMWP